MLQFFDIFKVSFCFDGTINPSLPNKKQKSTLIFKKGK